MILAILGVVVKPLYKYIDRWWNAADFGPAYQNASGNRMLLC